MSSLALLPDPQEHICFDKTEFMRDNHRVEQFVSDCRRRVPLEKLREDLEQYFRLLKTAMVDLINKDYAEFVNLSTNLVDLDKAISQLKPPLIRIKNDVEIIASEIDSGLCRIRYLLERKREILSKKLLLKHMIGLQEKLLLLETNEALPLHESAEIWNQLQHHSKNTRKTALAAELSDRISFVESRFLDRLENAFIEALGDENLDGLHVILWSFSSIDRAAVAESLVRQHLCKPYIKQCFAEKTTSELSQILNSLLDLVPTYISPLQNVIDGRHNGKAPIYGFDFITNSVFPEIVSGLQRYLPSLFIPSDNVQDFRERYILSMDFLNQLEHQCSSQSSVLRLRSEQSYSTFHSSFSLESFFSIVSKEIIEQVEEAFNSNLQRNNASNTVFKLVISKRITELLKKCLSKDTMLSPVRHKFFLLQIQIIFRFCKWASGQIAVCSDYGEEIDYASLVYLYEDLSTLIEEIPRLLEFEENDDDLNSVFSAANDELKKRIIESSSLIRKYVQDQIIARCLPIVKSVNDIPRQYRRTQRAPPSEPSPYIQLLVSPISDFCEKCPNVSSWTETLYDSIVVEFQSSIVDVLEASRKMEASLAKLQQMRKKQQGKSDDGLSDDEKIRKQIQLDVESFIQRFCDLGVPETNKNVQSLQELINF